MKKKTSIKYVGRLGSYRNGVLMLLVLLLGDAACGMFFEGASSSNSILTASARSNPNQELAAWVVVNTPTVEGVAPQAGGAIAVVSRGEGGESRSSSEGSHFSLGDWDPMLVDLTDVDDCAWASEDETVEESKESDGAPQLDDSLEVPAAVVGVVSVEGVSREGAPQIEMPEAVLGHAPIENSRVMSIERNQIYVNAQGRLMYGRYIDSVSPRNMWTRLTGSGAVHVIGNNGRVYFTPRDTLRKALGKKQALILFQNPASK